jgi:glycosyltransferase involved in cell wall biosynthesis
VFRTFDQKIKEGQAKFVVKIAIDALGINKFGGGRTATIFLLQKLFELDTKNQYLVALSAYEPSLDTPAGNVKQWIIPIRNRFLVRVFAQLTFPLKINGYDVVHFTKNLNLVGPLPPQIVTIFDVTILLHPELMPKIDYWYYKNIQKYTLRKAQRVITISKDVANGVKQFYGIPEELIRVVYLAAAEHFKQSSAEQIKAIREKYLLPEEYFVHVGHLDRKKNLTNLVRAFNIARQKTGFQGKLVLVGELYPKGHDAELVPTIHNLGLDNDVVFTGGVPDVDLPAILSGAMAKVFPSIHEGFGLAVIEAMACGTPVIVGRAGAVEEIVEDSGIILDQVDIDSIAEALIRIIKDNDLRINLSRKGLERSFNFSWEKAAAQTLKIYQELARG